MVTSTWRFRVWTFKDSWPWAFMGIGGAAAFLRAVLYNRGELPWKAWLVFGVTYTVIYGLTILHYVLRYQFKRKIVGYTRQGAAVLYGDDDIPQLLQKHALTAEQMIDVLSDELDDDIRFFQGKYPDKNIDRPFEGIYLSIKSKPFVPLSSANPAASTLGLVAGLYYMNEMVLCWLGDVRQLCAITRHEAGHRLFTVVGQGLVLGPEQDKIMSDWGYG